MSVRIKSAARPEEKWTVSSIIATRVRIQGRGFGNLVKLRTHSEELLLAHEVAHSFKQVPLPCMASSNLGVKT